MATEVRPLGIACNIRCHYCYQNPQRDARERRKPYNLEAIKSAILEEKMPFILFGGEPLLVPEDDLEHLWAWGLDRFKSNGIQTNGSLIKDSHIRLFKTYKVHVGISIDGPGELNDLRWAGSVERTREATKRTEAIIPILVSEGITPSLIVTLHRANATEDKLERLGKWIEELDSLGIKSVRLHILEAENDAIKKLYALTDKENIKAFIFFANIERKLKNIKFDIFRDIRDLLCGKDLKATCTWTGCDPYSTQAVKGIEGMGQKSNCGRTNKQGVDFVKSGSVGFERYISLYYTPQESGGCAGCPYFVMCKGQCPGTAISGDWRNRSEHCAVWKALFSAFEKSLLQNQTAKSQRPLTLGQRRHIESHFLKAWASGRNTRMADVLVQLEHAN